MQINEIIAALNRMAPPALQEDYDNAGLITGSSQWNCTGVLICLDSTEDVIDEAITNNCNLIVAHHPIIFRGLKKINGNHYVERTIIKAIKNDIAIYAIHTNLDNMLAGVNGKMADKLGLVNRQILVPKANLLRKLAVFVPVEHQAVLQEALFQAGAGSIGNYDECSFKTAGKGSFRPGEGTAPFSGQIGSRHEADEVKLEVIYPHWMESNILLAMRNNHPYEEVAYDIYPLTNSYQQMGAGIIGELETPVPETQFLEHLQQNFNVPCIKHTALTGKLVRKVALCGGAGSFLINNAIRAGSDVYVTGDVKYHEFFEAYGRLLLADIGHYESEQFTSDLLHEFLSKNFPNFAVLKTGVNTNPVHYFKA